MLARLLRWLLGKGDRRRYDRRPGGFPARCRVGDRAFDAQVVDISRGGVCLLLPVGLECGTEVVVCTPPQAPYLPNHSLKGRVAWRRDEHHGVAFLAARPELGSKDRRKESRVPAVVGVRLYDTRSKPLGEGATVDLSGGGLQVETDIVLRVGQRIEVALGPHGSLPVLRLHGQVSNKRAVLGGGTAYGIDLGRGAQANLKLFNRYFGRLEKDYLRKS